MPDFGEIVLSCGGDAGYVHDLVVVTAVRDLMQNVPVHSIPLLKLAAIYGWRPVAAADPGS